MASISIETVIDRLERRIGGYNVAINFYANGENAEFFESSIKEYRAIVAELEILKENFEDMKYKIELGL